MKTLIVVPLACVALVAGCASSDKMRQVESTSETNQKLLRETDQRLRTLEQSVNTLDTQVAQLNNRVYEVRTRGGTKNRHDRGAHYSAAAPQERCCCACPARERPAYRAWPGCKQQP